MRTVTFDGRPIQGGAEVAAGDGEDLRFAKHDGGAHDSGLDDGLRPGIAHQAMAPQTGMPYR